MHSTKSAKKTQHTIPRTTAMAQFGANPADIEAGIRARGAKAYDFLIRCARPVLHFGTALEVTWLSFVLEVVFLIFSSVASTDTIPGHIYNDPLKLTLDSSDPEFRFRFRYMKTELSLPLSTVYNNWDHHPRFKLFGMLR